MKLIPEEPSRKEPSQKAETWGRRHLANRLCGTKATRTGLHLHQFAAQRGLRLACRAICRVTAQGVGDYPRRACSSTLGATSGVIDIEGDYEAGSVVTSLHSSRRKKSWFRGRGGRFILYGRHNHAMLDDCPGYITNRCY